MNKILLSIFLVLFCTAGFAEEKYEDKRRYRKSSACVARESSVLSIMGWGIGLFAGIAILCSLIDNNPGPTSTTPVTQ